MAIQITDPRPWFAAKLLALVFPRYSNVNGLTALASGGQTGATPITKSIVRFTTVATSGDSSILPSAVPGMAITVINAGAAPMNVFPASGEKINALSADTAFSVVNNKTATFYCAVAGTWNSNLTA